MNTDQLQATINAFWEDHIVPALFEYIKIPNKSPSFDPDWEKNGHMERVLTLAADWTNKHMPKNAELVVKKPNGRTPLILVDIPGDSDGNVLMYGHLDKQPEMDGWNDGMGPWNPVIKGDKLYGRGGADDGYALFSSICAINALKDQNISLPRILILMKCIMNHYKGHIVGSRIGLVTIRKSLELMNETAFRGRWG